MIGRFENYLRKNRRRLSRSEWGRRLLNLAPAEHAPTTPGLLLIQIDGLSRSQFELALQQRKLPFLSHLLRKENYAARSLYSGIPSSMSAVQAELLYGVSGAVPGLSFYDRQNKTEIDLLDAESAAWMEKILEESGDPLLRGGCSYAGIFSGGADDIRFSMSDHGLRALPAKPNPRVVLFFLMSHFYSLARTAGLGGVEVVLALKDAIRGLASNREFRRELKHIPVRVAVSILLRELSVIGAKIDLARGSPILHVSFLGYDEQSHRRGPSSPYATWSLRGIDDAIARLWRAAQRASRRDYDVWIFSGHGQEDVDSYQRLHGRSVQEAIAETLGLKCDWQGDCLCDSSGIAAKRTTWIKRRRKSKKHVCKAAHDLIIKATGSLGHIYLPSEHPPHDFSDLAPKLVAEAKVPMAAVAAGENRATVFTSNGRYELPEDAAALFGPVHPYPAEAAEDLVKLCHHPFSGDIVISGWQANGKPLTFPAEGGAHGGPGAEETSGFVLLPTDAPIDWRPSVTMRPLDLRHAARAKLGQTPNVRTSTPLSLDLKRTQLRVMTYNVHSCVGMDGKIYPERVARVIAQYEPDIVALQEIDVDKARTGQVDQARIIAEMLKMEFHFHPCLNYEEEKYGDAILSLHPMQLIKAAALPRLNDPWLEPRGAIMIEVEAYGSAFRIINTHLSLSRRERILQAQALMGDEWMGDDSETGAPVILCGDLNSLPNSPVCRIIGRRLKDAQNHANGHRARNTWFGRIPLSRIDYVFLDKRLKVEKVMVPSTNLTRETSDHLPLIVDIGLK